MKIVTAYRGIPKNLGFSLLELVISMGILMVLISVLLSLFGQILDVQTASKSTSVVDKNGRYILARLTHDMQSATKIVTPATPGTQTDTLQITVNSVDYIYSLDSNGNLLLTANSVSTQLNSVSSTISNLSFTRIGSGDGTDVVRVGFRITSSSQQGKGAEQKNFQTTLGLN